MNESGKPTLRYPEALKPEPIPPGATRVWVVWLHIEQQFQLFGVAQKELADIYTSRAAAEAFVKSTPTIDTKTKRTFFTVEERGLKR